MGACCDVSIVGGNVLLPDGSVQRLDVCIKENAIEAVQPECPVGSYLDAAGCTVVPGLIDLHMHGVGTMSASDADLREIAEFEASRGCTTFVPTLFAPPEDLIGQMERHRRLTDELSLVPQAAGFRLESPYIARTGAGVSEDLAPISEELTAELLRAGGGHIRIWDISPELDGAAGLIRELSASGIVCSIAHTDAPIALARDAVDAGARLVTHLFDTFAVPEMVEPGAYPAGLVDYLLIEDRLVCEIIADGLHVDPILVEKALRCKGEGRIAFVTDSNLGAGLPPGRYQLSKWGLAEVNGCNAGVRLVDREMVLAGSALTPIDAFRNAINLFGCDIARASELCSRTPARLLGLNKGEIAPGRDADLIALGPGLELRFTISGGRVTYAG